MEFNYFGEKNNYYRGFWTTVPREKPSERLVIPAFANVVTYDPAICQEKLLLRYLFLCSVIMCYIFM